MSGSAIAARVTAGLKRAVSKTSDGETSAAIIRPSVADESAYPPIPGGPPVSYPCTALLVEYSEKDRAGTEITTKDVMVLIAPDVAVTPRNDDKLEIAGETLHINYVAAMKPGNVVLMWKCNARRS